MIDKELLDILACPENKTPVSMAEQTIIDQLNEQIANGKITNRGGKIVENPLDGGLIREDKKFLYPIDDGIRIMLIDEAISLDQSS